MTQDSETTRHISDQDLNQDQVFGSLTESII